MLQEFNRTIIKIRSLTNYIPVQQEDLQSTDFKLSSPR